MLLKIVLKLIKVSTNSQKNSKIYWMKTIANQMSKILEQNNKNLAFLITFLLLVFINSIYQIYLSDFC